MDQTFTYAVGDIHGEITLLQRLLAQLPLRDEDTLLFLGDYLDQGEDSIATILALQALKHERPATIFLRGNHEDAWLRQWDGASFRQAPGIAGARKVWESCNGQVPFVIGDWLEETCIEYEDEHAYYVHAGLLPGKPIWRTPTHHKMWGAQGFLTSDYNWGKPVVFGHWKRMDPLLEPNKIGIDTGAYKYGILTAVRLPDCRIFQARR